MAKTSFLLFCSIYSHFELKGLMPEPAGAAGLGGQEMIFHWFYRKYMLIDRLIRGVKFKPNGGGGRGESRMFTKKLDEVTLS